MLGPETPMQTFERLRKWRFDSRKDAWRDLWYARMWNKGHFKLPFFNGMPLFQSHASEEAIQEAIKRLNYSSWEHHRP